ncbi:PREDICTED: cirhin [Tinamus guttatus]|uniref:cirhin n=1 Tax=Tinamus guttatus TaxID=94827 RepID=UPI00052F3820|nr:PREDICTED: cirhin [Tinamus guttatus]
MPARLSTALRVVGTSLFALAVLGGILAAYVTGYQFIHTEKHYLSFGLYGAILGLHLFIQSLFAFLEHRRMRHEGCLGFMVAAPFQPQRRLVSCARHARLLLFQFSQHLELWRLGSTDESGKDGEVLPVSRVPEHLVQLKSKGPEHIYCSCVSPCGGWIAYSTASRFHLYRHHCAVPKYSCAVTALAIHPLTNNLVIAYADQQLFEFSIPEKQYTAWSRTVQNDGLHKAWLERDSPITHIAFNPRNPSHILLHDVYMFCVLDKSLPLPDDSASLMNQSTLKQLPATARKRQLHAFKICKKFQPLLFADLLDENCLVMVERPIMDIKTQLPPPIQQKKFGT